MVDRVSVHGLAVARALHDFIANEALPESGIDPQEFWAGFAALAVKLMPQNRALLAERDRLVLFRGPQHQGATFALGMAMFGATTILSAHVPRPLRVIFDGPVHLGPAIFDGGGMGAGIAGRAF